jgi:hypothetical protein
MQEHLTELEQHAVRVMRNLGSEASFHDYSNVVQAVRKAYRVVNSAYRAISQADEDLRELEDRQRI